MAGRGTRTQNAGEFKPFIEINNLKMIQWFLRSVKNNFNPDDNLCFVTRRVYFKKYDFEATLNKIIKAEGINNSFSLEYAEDEKCDLGQAMTVYQMKNKMHTAERVIVANCDQYLSFAIPSDESKSHGFMTINIDLGNSKSFVRISDGYITEIKEKENISNIASTGVYGISDAELFVWALEKMFDDGLTVNGEFYVAPSLNYLIKEKNYLFQPIISNLRFDLGTINGIDVFKTTITNLKIL